MKRRAFALARKFSVIFALALLAGCGGGSDGENLDYTGNWHGRTSNGGTIAFTVAGDWVPSLRLSDSQGVIWFPQAVEVRGNSFSARYDTNTAATDEIFLECTFGSADQATGRYWMRKGGNVLTGTFEAQRS